MKAKAAMDVSPDEGGLSMSDRDDKPGGPQYGGERGGPSQGADGGQADATEESGHDEDTSHEQHEPGRVGGRGPTETERQG